MDGPAAAKQAGAYRHRRLRLTGNALEAWLAIADWPDDQPLPEWIRQYLRLAALSILALSEDENTMRAMDRVPEALRLKRRGWNAFKADRATSRREAFALLVEQRRAAGTTLAEALDQVKMRRLPADQRKRRKLAREGAAITRAAESG